MTITRKQIGSLTGLRAIAALWVMLMHFREITPTRIWSFPVFDQFVSQGALGVDLFFVLSGFILSYVYFDLFSSVMSGKEYFSFLVFRFGRIYPVHVFAFTIMVLLYTVHSFFPATSIAGSRYDLRTVVSTLMLTHAWFPGIQTPNMPAWSISAEWFAYMMFPCLCWLLSRRKLFFLFYVLLVSVISVFNWHREDHLLHVMSGFLIGVVTFYVRAKVDLPQDSHQACYSRYGGLWVLLVTLLFLRESDLPVVVYMVLFACLIFCLSNSQDALGRVLSLSVVVYVGEISYSLYMLHWPARVMVRGFLERVGLIDALWPGFIVVIYVVCSFSLAVLSYYYVELPGRSLIRSIAARKAPAIVRSA